MTGSLKKNWQPYMMELFGLAGFVCGAGLLTIFLEHPDLPVMQSSWKYHDTLRRIPIGIIMGIYVTVVTLLISRRSGAHLNPAVTWTFLRLHKMTLKDAVLYVIFQFAGAVLASQVLKYAVGHWFSHPTVNYGVTAPKPQYHALTAFIAEFLISFIMMLTVLLASASKKWEKKVPLLVGLLIAAFIVFEMPFSGMSMNPARSFSAALAAMKFEHLWIYFVAPVAAMLLAGEIFIKINDRNQSQDKKELPIYPS